MTGQEEKKGKEKGKFRVSLSEWFREESKAEVQPNQILLPEERGKEQEKPGQDHSFSEKELSERTRNFLSSISGSLKEMHKPYMVEFVRPEKSANQQGIVSLTLTNMADNEVSFFIKIKGIGNLFFENFRLNKGEIKQLHLQPGTYEMTESVDKHYLKKNSKIAENEEWIYKRRSDGTNFIQGLVTLTSGSYFVGLGGNLSKEEFQKLLKELESASYE